MSELTIQFEIKAALTKLGYIVLSTSSVAAGRPRRARSTSSGVPDLLISHDKWQEGMWLGLEVKTAKGKPTTEQQELLDRGRIVAVRSVDEALRVMDWGKL